MRFPYPGRSQENDVLVLGDEGEVEEFHHRLLVQLRMEGEVIGVDGLRRGQPGHRDRHVHPPFLLRGHLFLEEAIEEGAIRKFLFFRRSDDRVEDLPDPGKLQTGEILLEAFVDQLLHDAPPASRSYSARERTATSGKRLAVVSPRVALPFCLPYFTFLFSLSSLVRSSLHR